MKSFYIKLCSLAAISSLGIAVYFNTFHSSFHFDDEVFIIHNYAIRNFHHLFAYWEFYPCRFITFVSLTVNYHFNELNVFGYHLFNLAVHLEAAIFVWWLTLLTFSTPAMKTEKITRHAHLIAFFTGLVFVSHPVQIEAVTYIWQRTASMAALFYLASLCFYVKSRLLSSSSLPARFCYVLSLIIAIVAMFTKENTVTLPLMILTYEFFFFEGEKYLNWRRISPFMLSLLIIPLTIVLTKARQFQAIQHFVAGPGGTTPIQYLLTQFKVMVIYLRLIFLPLNQNLDYDISISKSIFEMPVLLGLFLISSILLFAKHIFSRYRLLSFSIIWFFLTLVPESSFFPLKNVIFEHRLYLPLAGYCMFLVSGLYYLTQKNSLKWMIVVLTMIITFNSILTYQRNKVWKNEITLWDDAVLKSSHKARPIDDRAFAYYLHGNLAQAISDYNKAIKIDPDLADAYVGRGLSYSDQGKLTQALSDDDKAIKLDPAFADAFNNRGIIYLHLGKLKEAISDLTKAVDLDHLDAKAYYNRGLCYGREGHVLQAVSDYNKAIELDNTYADAYYNRGLCLAQQKLLAEAIADFNKVIEIDPNYADAYNNRGIAYAMQSNITQARSDFNQAIKINPKDAEAYYNRGNTYYQQGDTVQADSDYNKSAEVYSQQISVDYKSGKYDEAWDNVHKAQDYGIVLDAQLMSGLKAASGRDK